MIDNQLSPRLATFLAERGHDAVHVMEVGLESAQDEVIWRWAIGQSRVVVSKDEDFLYLANRPGDQGRFLWVRLGNCRRDALVDAASKSLEAVVSAFESDQRVVELV